MASRACFLVASMLVAVAWSQPEASRQAGRAWHPELQQIEDLLAKMDGRIVSEQANVTKRYVGLVADAREAALKRREALNATLGGIQAKLTSSGDAVDSLKDDIAATDKAQAELDAQMAQLDGELSAAREDYREEQASAQKDLDIGREANEKTRDESTTMLKEELKSVATINELIGQLHMARQKDRYKKLALTDAKGAPSINGTAGYGGGFDPSTNQLVFPLYAKEGATRCVRYDAADGVRVAASASFGGDAKVGNMIMQVWYDADGSYYLANYNTPTVKKLSKDDKVLWTAELPDPDNSVAVAVAADDKFAYAMAKESSGLTVIDKKTGKVEKTVTLKGGPFTGAKTTAECGSTSGGLVVGEGKLFYGCNKSPLIYSYDLKSLNRTSAAPPIRAASKIEVSVFDGSNMCVGDRGDTLHCYTVFEDNIYDKAADASNAGVRPAN